MPLEEIARATSILHADSDNIRDNAKKKVPVEPRELPTKDLAEKTDNTKISLEKPKVYYAQKKDSRRDYADLPIASALFSSAMREKTPESKDSSLLHISYEGEKLEADPKALVLKEVSSQVSFTFKDEENEQNSHDDVAIFVRNNSIVAIEKEKSKIIATDAGNTELFVVYHGKMIIIPISVGHDWDAPAMLPEDTEDNLQNALNHRSNKAVGLSNTLSVGHAPQPATGKIKKSVSKGYSLRSSETTAQLNKIQDQRNGNLYQWKSIPRQTKLITFQVVDERSFPEENILFPVSSMLVHIIGTKYSAPTDIQGKVQFYDVPDNGRLMVKISDPAGNYLPSMAEVPLVFEDENDVVIIKLLSQKTFDLYQNVYSIAQQSDKASLCGRFVPNSSQKDEQTFSGVRIALNLASSGPRYFNRFGPADSQIETDTLGRFCFFNVKPGLAEVTVRKGNEYLTSFVTPLLTGLHEEEDIRLKGVENPAMNLVGLPSFSHQIYGSRFESNLFSTVDFAQLVVVGETSRLNFLEAGIVDNGGDVMDVFKNRVYLLNQSPEFEPALYAVDELSTQKDHIVPLLQRGFVEDLILELGSTGDVSSPDFDAALGSIIVYMPKSAKLKSDLSIKLFNSEGTERDGGWYFGEQDPLMAKAIFYNLEKGHYLAVAQDRDGAWHSANTMPVDYWTTSFLVLGGAIVKTDMTDP